MTGARPVFISYSSDDVERVIAAVRFKWADHATRCFIDRETLRQGDVFARHIDAQIDGCEEFHLFWSAAAARSEWVRRELARAVDRWQREGGPDGVIRVTSLDETPVPPEVITAVQVLSLAALAVPSEAVSEDATSLRARRGGDRDTIFISYSSKDAATLHDLLQHLKPLRRERDIEIWSDLNVGGYCGSTLWYAEIGKVLDRARVAICLVSEHYLASDVCMEEELPYLLQHGWRDRSKTTNELRPNERLEIMPLLLRPCGWQRYPWIADLPWVRGDGIGLDHLPPGMCAEVFVHLGIRIEGAIMADAMVMPRPDLRPLPREEFDLDHLPETGHLLLGRRDDWNRLDKAARAGSDVRIVVLRAQGGAGKSTLARVWVDALRDRGLPGFERAFAWSFYSQGTREQATSADLFVAEALRFFGDRGPDTRDPWEKGERLAALIAAQRTLLVLDGLEPLQSESVDPALHGAIKDPSLLTLLECLARDNPGLCVVTTREPLVDLDGMAGVSDWPLDTLSPVACRALLRIAGVAGGNRELEAAAEGLGHHALAMHLLGTWLRGFQGSHIANVTKLPRMEKIAVDAAWHPRRVMEAWADRLVVRGEAAALELLGVLGLFDRPADRRALVAVLEGERVDGLNGRLWHKGSAVIDPALATLRAAGLVVRARSRGQRSIGEAEGEIEAHPLVREHFGERLRRAAPMAWKTGHERLYRHFAGVAEFQPATLVGLEPLFRAVLHGCAAGRYEEVLVDVFRLRIRRGTEHYILRKLGAYAADLAALAGFFAAPWQRPQPALPAPAQTVVLGWAGLGLRALGRLAEGVAPIETVLAGAVEQADWTNAAAAAGSLAELLLTLGRLGDSPAAAPGTVERAREAVVHADRSGNWVQRMATRTILADALHQRGSTAEARELAMEAERMMERVFPHLPQLSSLQGYRYGDLLLTLGQPAEARRRAEWCIEKRPTSSLLCIALDHLLLGRAALVAAPGPDHPDFALARHQLDAAVTGLRKAGGQEFIPLGFLARAALHRHASDLPAARSDLDAAHRIATRGGMRLHLVDHQIESAWLHRDTGDRTAARTAYTIAHAEVEAIGYHRRDAELKALDKAIHEA